METNLLLDTQILIWMAQQPEKLTFKVNKAILNPDNHLYLSYVSIWEMAIKSNLGKLNLDFTLEEFIQKACLKHQIQLLDIAVEHIYYTQNLDHHHKAPFDRLLAAQTFVEDMPIVSSDEIFDKYNVKRLW